MNVPNIPLNASETGRKIERIREKAWMNVVNSTAGLPPFKALRPPRIDANEP
ncbi:hypothetical protein HSRCO_2104 [Halanaeroarchaeum sp. HSR-CO]|nr:hypothetical protein HSRCO_2104 [Halanaeroarchaeum sp. HSR-CO]